MRELEYHLTKHSDDGGIIYTLILSYEEAMNCVKEKKIIFTTLLINGIKYPIMVSILCNGIRYEEVAKESIEVSRNYVLKKCFE